MAMCFFDMTSGINPHQKLQMTLTWINPNNANRGTPTALFGFKLFEYLKSTVEDNPDILGMRAFPNIMTDTSGAIGVIRYDNQWLSDLLFLSDGWMVE